ncbi:unnamed protein product [Coccothraustes coccothraustes]
MVLLAKVSCGCAGVIQLLDLLELPDSFLLVLERPEWCQELEAIWHCTSCKVLHRDIHPMSILLDLASGQLRPIDFGCGTFLQDTAYTQFAVSSQPSAVSITLLPSLVPLTARKREPLT